MPNCDKDMKEFNITAENSTEAVFNLLSGLSSGNAIEGIFKWYNTPACNKKEFKEYFAKFNSHNKEI